MKKLVLLGGLVFALSVAGSVAGAAVITRTANVTAVVTSSATLTADVKLISNDTGAAALDFGSVAIGATAWNNKPNQYVSLKVINNSLSWRLRLTTNNFATAPSTATWGFSYGALITNTPGAKIPLGWRASTSTVVGVNPPAGDPGANPTVGWTFIKDQNDADDPAPESTGNESFAWVDANTGYCNIAFGSAAGTNVVALAPGVTESAELANPTDPFKLFIEGNFAGATAGTYNQDATDRNKLFLDLIYD